MNPFTKLLKQAVATSEKATLYKLAASADGSLSFFAKNKTGDIVSVQLKSELEFKDQAFSKIYKKENLIKKYPVLAYAKEVEYNGEYFDRAESAETYNGKKRSELKDEDFIDSENRSFPVVNCKNVRAAVNTWGLYKGDLSFETFKKRLTEKAKKIGCESSLPKSWKE